jgi:hypothetical protein
MSDLDHKTLTELLDYNQETGVFIWKVKRYRELAGQEIKGSLDKDGYKSIKLFQVRYKVHRLAWFYVYKTWPKNCIDHINGIKTDNKICNLRDVTKQENSYNLKKARKNNKHSKFLGVSYAGYGKYNIKNKWVALIRINKKTTRIGSYKTPEEAHQAYIEAKRIYHSTCTL